MKVIVMLLAALAYAGVTVLAAEEKKPMESKNEFAVLGGGCFWCMEAVFEHVPGVKSVVSGYAGGHTRNPSYEEVCTDMTGHAEVVRIEFDPAVVSYGHLLDVFWNAHDPTTPDRQGADQGTQYRSIILFADEAQKAAAEKSKTAAQARYSDPIVTEIVPLKEFFPAEEYHQHYFAKNPTAGYCRLVIKPKVSKLQKEGVIGK
ncbi:MAG: peptide-methionine (S)-S-oxide reductase MsrA [Opitutaceae bacterium]|jgi:peptide-methionine (S)-S-oxide reductase